VLLLGSIAAILWGFAELSEITAGVGLFAVAGVLAIFARIAQAGRHQRENQERHERLIGRLNRLGEKE
jgi:membrane protein implicated in regulation of membrane protease activity